MTRRFDWAGVLAWTHRTRCDLPAPEAPSTGTTSTPLFVGRSRKSSRNSASVTTCSVWLWRPVADTRRMSSGAWVARKTLSLGLTASVAIVAKTFSRLQHTYPVSSDILDLPDDHVRDHSWLAALVWGRKLHDVSSVGTSLHCQPTAQLPAV